MLLHRAAQIADEAISKAIAEHDTMERTHRVTPRQAVVLWVVSQSNNPSQNHLVERTGIDRSTVADMVRRLVERKMIARSRCKTDARRYELRPTTFGQDALDLAIKADASCGQKIDALVDGIDGLAIRDEV